VLNWLSLGDAYGKQAFWGLGMSGNRHSGQRFVLDRALGGRRLEEVILEFRPELSRSAVARLIKRGGVWVDGAVMRRTGPRLPAGSRIEIDWEAGRAKSPGDRPVRAQKTPEQELYGRHFAGPLGAAPGERDPAERRGAQDQGTGPGGSSRGTAQASGDGQKADAEEPNCLEAGEPAHRLLPGLEPGLLAELVDAAASLDIIYADDDIVVVNKPATEKDPHGSLADLARLRYGRMPLIMGDNRPGIVHRLDRETSGAIVLARTPEAMDDLREQFRNREVEKVYLAIAHRNADFESTVLDWDLEQKPGDTDRQEYLEKGKGKEAETEVSVEERFGHATLVSCVPRTGRRHQIRVHLYAAGLPVVGDVLYGGRKGPQLPEGAPRLRRHALHAVELTIRHPTTGEYLGFGAEMPADMELLLEWLRG
jgi:23S rRNA pseudouridine1911/1915/1917 synthase